MKLIKIIATLAIVASLASCTKEEPDRSLSVTFSADSLVLINPGQAKTVTYKMVSATGSSTIELVSYQGINEPKLYPNAQDPQSGKIQFQAKSGAVEKGAKAVFHISNGYKDINYTFFFETEDIQFDGENMRTVPAEGGTVTLDYGSNVKCIPTIPSDVNWVHISETKGLTPHSVTLTVDKNEGLSRQCVVTVKSYISSLAVSYSIVQSGLGEILCFRSTSESLVSPQLVGENIEAVIDWGDGRGLQEWTPGIKSNYTDAAKSHEITIESVNVEKAVFNDISGLSTLDLSRF